MTDKTNYLETAFLNHIFRTTKLTGPTNVYIGLFTATPGETGGGTEVTGGAYARVTVAAVDAQWAAPADSGGRQQTSNTNAITFPTPTANWGTVTQVGISDAATAGNVLYYGTLGTARTINNGDQAPSFAAGALTIAEG